MKLSQRTLLLGALGLFLAAVPSTAQIERLDLTKMVTKTDEAVIGKITGREVFRIDHPIDGPELYYTTLFVEGESLYTGSKKTHAVTFPGGFINDEEGVFNSEAPSADEIAIGNKVVVFSLWSDNMGGDVAANALYASHGGIYQVFEARNRETIVQGRGDGYAIERNVKAGQLKTQIQNIRQALGR